MNNNQVYTLINGKFSLPDAKEILLNMYAAKIQFHEARNFSSLERIGKSDNEAVYRIGELKTEVERIRTLMEVANSHTATVSISARIELKFTDDQL